MTANRPHRTVSRHTPARSPPSPCERGTRTRSTVRGTRLTRTRAHPPRRVKKFLTTAPSTRTARHEFLDAADTGCAPPLPLPFTTAPLKQEGPPDGGPARCALSLLG